MEQHIPLPSFHCLMMELQVTTAGESRQKNLNQVFPGFVLFVSTLKQLG